MPRRLAQVINELQNLALDLEYIEAQAWAKPIIIARPGGCQLTPMELEVAKMTAEGKTGGEIAKILYRSSRTIEGTISRICDKTGALNRTHAIALLFQKQILK